MAGPVITSGSGEEPGVKVMKVKKRLVELGAPPELVAKARAYWLGNEEQAIKTYNKLHGE